MFARLDDDFNRAVHKQNAGRMAFKKNLRARVPHKNTQSAYRVAARHLCQPSIYLPLFEIYDGRAAVSLSCLIKPPCARMERVLRVMR